MPTIRGLLVCLLIGLAPAFASAEKTLQTAQAAPPWAPAKATGAPDVPQPGDHGNAWASLSADAGAEWLRLEFAEPAPIAEVRVHQNLNPGAIVRITAETEKGELEIWSTAGAIDARPVLTAKARTRVEAKAVTLHFDTTRVAGWNEVDAVELVSTDGRRQWAMAATASSTYASAGGAVVQDAYASLIGRDVRVRVDGESISGRLVAADSDTLQLADGSRNVLIARMRISYLEWRD